MIHKSKIGLKFEPIIAIVNAWQLKLFGESIGETNAIYLNEEAAKAAGYKGLPAPPTFGVSLALASPDPFRKYTDLGIDLNKMLHAEQNFDFEGQIYSGDVITTREQITDLFQKRGGALEFVVVDANSHNQHGEKVGQSTSTLVIQHGAPA